jgi:aspartate-semialdehyde dehydrogenase
LDNVIPFIGGEEDKVEREPLKLLGKLQDGQVVNAPFVISAQCNRVPVRDGHTECVSVEFESKPDVGEIIAALENFQGPSDVAGLPSTPVHPIVVRREANRPQPVFDRDTGKGMSVVVGRVRLCPVFDFKFVVLGHNTIRGAASGSIHNAELLVAQNMT